MHKFVCNIASLKSSDCPVGISFVYRGCDKVFKVAAFSPSELVPFSLRHPLHVTFQLTEPVIPTVVPL